MRLRLALVLLPVAAVVLFAAHRAGADSATPSERDDGTLEIPAATRAAGLTFAPAVAPGDRAWILAAIAHARPEAQRLVDQVDGLVTFTADQGAGGSDSGVTRMGWTMPTGTRFTVGLNVAELDGERAMDRNTVVLHELGHVIDFALIPPALDATLDAGIPHGGSCGVGGGPFGGCAPAPERIADTFAKWALGGAVSAVGAGYEVAMPPSLETWGEPLGALAQQG
jgi:hypothetical protein